MITKKQYEAILRQMKDRGLRGSAVAITETIEALEKVTRAVQTLDLMKAGLEGGSQQSINKAEMSLAVAMADIPDWLTGANHQ